MSPEMNLQIRQTALAHALGLRSANTAGDPTSSVSDVKDILRAAAEFDAFLRKDPAIKTST